MKESKLKWVDVQEIVFLLDEGYPDIDPRYISFPDLFKKVTELSEFDDDGNRCNEKILEAIQQFWCDERSF